MDGKEHGGSDYLLLSGIQHFALCRRQWALIHIETQWDDNYYTISGELMHTRAHNPILTEKRSDLLVVRDMPILSHELRTRGKCDVVEFRRDEEGISLYGRQGLWRACPVEYKRGHPKAHNADRLQLCAQAMCLEEMLACPPIQTAYLYYGEVKRREAVELDDALRETVRTIFVEMHSYFDRQYTPRVKAKKECEKCSLTDVCLPDMPRGDRVSAYIASVLAEDE